MNWEESAVLGRNGPHSAHKEAKARLVRGIRSPWAVGASVLPLPLPICSFPLHSGAMMGTM